ncbi:hypothetical protein FB451DRAFT_1221105 [Mycena latifolia]|nr:hypothetical protein FB451DRAFT_1221105 [Mycena latifolia]
MPYAASFWTGARRSKFPYERAQSMSCSAVVELSPFKSTSSPSITVSQLDNKRACGSYGFPLGYTLLKPTSALFSAAVRVARLAILLDVLCPRVVSLQGSCALSVFRELPEHGEDAHDHGGCAVAEAPVPAIKFAVCTPCCGGARSTTCAFIGPCKERYAARPLSRTDLCFGSGNLQTQCASTRALAGLARLSDFIFVYGYTKPWRVRR